MCIYFIFFYNFCWLCSCKQNCEIIDSRVQQELCVFQLDNPVSILSQEMSKQFLHSKNESDKYKVPRCQAPAERPNVTSGLRDSALDLVISLLISPPKCLLCFCSSSSSWKQRCWSRWREITSTSNTLRRSPDSRWRDRRRYSSTFCSPISAAELSPIFSLMWINLLKGSNLNFFFMFDVPHVHVAYQPPSKRSSTL